MDAEPLHQITMRVILYVVLMMQVYSLVVGIGHCQVDSYPSLPAFLGQKECNYLYYDCLDVEVYKMIDFDNHHVVGF